MHRCLCGFLAATLCLAAAPASSADEPAVFPFEFKAEPPSKALPARFQPGSASIPLRAGAGGPAAGHDHRMGVLRVGADGERPRRVVIARSKVGEAYDRLMIDTDGDGALDDEKPIQARMQSTGQTIYSTFSIVLRVNHGGVGKPHLVEHPFQGYLTVSSKSEKPGTFQYRSQGHLRGAVKVDGKPCEVLLSDRNNDARFGTGDAWTVRTLDGAEGGTATNVGEPVTIGKRTLWLLLGSTGAAKPRLGEEGAEAARAGPADAGSAASDHPEDAELPRAEMPLPFENSIKDANAAALKIQGPVFLSFESQASKDTRAMQALVFTALGVVDAAAGLSSARIDIDMDDGKALAASWKVKEAPTGILLDPNGKEVARYKGYQSVKDFRAFLGHVDPWLKPSDDEPELKGKAAKRSRTIIKQHIKYLEKEKSQGLLVDRITDLGTRKNRGARDALIKFASTRKSKEYIASAFFALAEIGGRVAIEYLCGPKALGSKDFLVAQQAAEALGKAKDESAIRSILGVLYKKGTKIEVVSACCITLAKSAPKDDRVIKAVFEHSEHGKDTIRAGAAEALGYLASDEALTKLKAILDGDKNARVRSAAATGFGWTLRPEVIPWLRTAIANDNSHHVRTAAHEAIQYLQRGGD